MKSIYVFILLLLIPTRLITAQSNVPSSPLSPSGEVRYAGSEIAPSDAEKKATLIFVGTLQDLGQYDLTDAGVMAFHQTKVKITRVLKGRLTSSSEVTVEISPMLIAKKGWEAVPKVGSSYIFFVKNERNKIETSKLLSATDDNITQVKAIVAANSAVSK